MATTEKRENGSQKDTKGEDEMQIVLKDWQLSREARVYMNCLFHRKMRVQFGHLEHPGNSSSLIKKAPVYICKLLLYGKAGVGKTSTVLKLAGRAVPALHQETMGIQTTTLYWPAKLAETEEVVLLHLELWDTGEKSLRKYDHILPSMLSATNGIAFCFSYTDRNSWNELPSIITQATSTRKIDSHLKVVIATRVDSTQHKVTQEEVELFEREHNIKVLSIGNVNRTLLSNGWPDGQIELVDVANMLNRLTELVIHHQKGMDRTLDLSHRTSKLEISDV